MNSLTEAITVFLESIQKTCALSSADLSAKVHRSEAQPGKEEKKSSPHVIHHISNRSLEIHLNASLFSRGAICTPELYKRLQEQGLSYMAIYKGK